MSQFSDVPRRSKIIFGLWVAAIVASLWAVGTIISGTRAQSNEAWLAHLQSSLTKNLGASSWDKACAETGVSWACDFKSMKTDGIIPLLCKLIYGR